MSRSEDDFWKRYSRSLGVGLPASSLDQQIADAEREYEALRSEAQRAAAANRIAQDHCNNSWDQLLRLYGEKQRQNQ